MRSIQTSHTFPLSSVKPLEGLMRYRHYCLEETRRVLETSSHAREFSPISRVRLEPFGQVDGFEYLRCPETGSLFLGHLPDPAAWASLLSKVSLYRHSRQAFHSGIAKSRTENVYAPKLEWIRSTLKLQGFEQARLMEVVTLPSEFTPPLADSGAFAEVVTVNEMELAASASVAEPCGDARDGSGDAARDPVEAAVLLESLDRVSGPVNLVAAVARRLREEGLLFVTALVASGFDMVVLGARNLYLYPPDRANCFSLAGLTRLIESAGFTLLEVSTPGVLDLEVVRSHLKHDPTIPLSKFETQVIQADEDAQARFQQCLQETRMSSFARIVAKKERIR